MKDVAIPIELEEQGRIQESKEDVICLFFVLPF
jgi:hypothetical protein